MYEAPRFRILDLLGLLLVVACAAGLRAGYVVLCTTDGDAVAPFAVQGQGPKRSLPGPDGTRRSELEDLVRHLRETPEQPWFGCLAPLSDQEEETADIAPGYPWLLGLAGRVDRPDMVTRWTQVGLGTLTVLCYFFFARRAFGSTLAGTVAGLLTALDPFWIINSAELADGALVSFLLAAALLLGTRGSQTGAPFASLLYGLALAGLAMVRAALLPFAIIAFVWYLARCRFVSGGGLAALLALLGFANGLAPWALRNWQAFAEPLPIVDSAYLHLWMGNNRLATGATLDEDTLRESLRRNAATTEERERFLRQLLDERKQPHRYAQLAPELLAQVTADPAGTLGHRLDAGVCYLLGGSWVRTHRLSTSIGEDAGDVPQWLVQSLEPALAGSLLFMLLLAALGWRWSAGWAWQSRLATLAAIWIPLPYLLSHAEELSGPRLPLDGVLLSYAAFALCCLFPGFARTPQDAEQASRPA
jgi:4-amino-4-deoxy-L-arabinose transferase-like glycosyltransferase